MDFLEQSLLWRASAGRGCSRMASQSFLAFAVLGLSPSCSSLALFLCFALDLPWLSSPVQPPFTLPVWHCPFSRPRGFLVNPWPPVLMTLCVVAASTGGGADTPQVSSLFRSNWQHCRSNEWHSTLPWSEWTWCQATLISHSPSSEDIVGKGLCLPG